MRLMEGPDELAGPENLGNPGLLMMIELAEAVKGLTGSRSEFVHEPLPQDDPKQRQPDITFAREQLGWEPRVALRNGLRPTIAYLEGLLRRVGSVWHRCFGARMQGVENSVGRWARLWP